MPQRLSRLDPSRLRLHAFERGPQPRQHFVELYADDLSLVSSLRTFIATGVSDGESAIVFATPEHREELETNLERVLDFEALRKSGRYIALDAAEMLNEFIGEDGLPNTALFDAIIGDAIRRLLAGGHNVRAFGEMVALLWAEGNVGGALAVEDLWNDLAEEHPFRLFCAYPLRVFGEVNQAPLAAVCERHSHVVTPLTAA